MSSHFMLEYYRARYPDYPAGLKDARYRKLEREIAALDPDGRLAGLWAEENGMTAWYLRSVLDEEGNDHTVWQGTYA